LQLGFGYRHDAGILGRFVLNISDKFQIAYAYGFALTDLAKVSSGSHEFLLGFKLCNKTRKMPNDIAPIPVTVVDPVIDTVYVDGPVVIDTVVVEKIIEDDKVELEHTIYYEQSQSTFDESKEKVELAKIVSYLNENKDAVIYIKGYASEEGTDYANFKLSGDRTKNVYAYLLKQGVPRSQMISIVQGEAAEHHGVDDKEKDSENRRVTVVLK
jgi:outer membrane protein OmpA-like peptidoglycan-associated protein